MSCRWHSDSKHFIQREDLVKTPFREGAIPRLLLRRIMSDHFPKWIEEQEKNQ